MSFLGDVTGPLTFVDRGIEAMQIITKEYMQHFKPKEPPLRWTINPFIRD